MKKNHLVWIDLEMTGLSPECERIIEIASIVTDDNLTVIAEGPSLAIHQSDTLLANMDEWNQTHHQQSGLIKRVKESTVTEQQAEEQTLNFLSQFVESGVSPLCGNSVHQDRRFLSRYMPQLEQFFHYRIIDVSTVKELMKRWAPTVYEQQPDKVSQHVAIADIRDSINELRYYRQYFPSG